MTTVLVVTICDGCGGKAGIERPSRLAKAHPRPASWLRLVVRWSLPSGTERSRHLTICSPQCAGAAVAGALGAESAGATA